MPRPRKVMLLVDFDNVSPDVIEQAFHVVMSEYGAIHVRRAYCTAEHAQQHAGFLKRLSLRPMVNLAVGKNSTDIALAVDAMDLVIAERPEVVVLVSSDSDYTPLVGRLREKGCWVRGFGQLGKTGDGVPLAYDEFGDLAHGDGRAAARRGDRAPARGSSRPAPAAPANAAPRRDGRGEPRENREPREGRNERPARPPRVIEDAPVASVASAAAEAAPTPTGRGDRPAGSGRRRGRGGNAAERAARAAAREEMARLDAAAESAEAPPPVVVEAPAPVPAEPAVEAPAPRPRRPARKPRDADAAPAVPAEAVPTPPVETPVEATPPAEPAKAARAAKTPARPRAAAKKAAAQASDYPPAIEAILAAVPALHSGEKIGLGEAAQALREAELLAKTAASTRLFKQHIDYFVLSPDRQPNKVQFIGADKQPT